MAGETPEQTVRRLRLHRAAVALGRDAAPLVRIARAAGYASSEAFSRAFSAAYGQSPTAFRAQRAAPGGSHPYAPLPAMPSAQENASMTTSQYPIELKTCAGYRLFGQPHEGDYNEIGATFDRLFALAGAHGLIGSQTRSFGIYYDDPAAVPAERRRAFAGLAVDASALCPQGLEETTIPAGEVACLLHKGPYADLERAYQYLYGAWLPGSGHEPADTPCFEEYLNDPRSLPASEWLTAVCLPVVR